MKDPMKQALAFIAFLPNFNSMAGNTISIWGIKIIKMRQQ
jgi:hypothetical protein